MASLATDKDNEPEQGCVARNHGLLTGGCGVFNSIVSSHRKMKMVHGEDVSELYDAAFERSPPGRHKGGWKQEFIVL
jgi:hypothetical protein